MNTKLTLTMDKAVIEMAKKYAKEEGRSLSDLVENYFKMISSSSRTEEKIKEVAEDPTPYTTSLLGVMKLPKDFDPEKELQERREKKYLKK